METKKISKIFKALSNDNRLELYLKIRGKNTTSFNNCTGCRIQNITRKMKIGAPTISHHLKELENAGLITLEKDGKHLIAKINDESIKIVKEVLKK